MARATAAGTSARLGRLLALPVAAWLLIHAPPALSEEELYEPPNAEQVGDRKRAEELFAESKEHYRAGRFTEAIALLTEAYDLVGEPVLQYNLARAYEGSGDFEKAVAAYERYLAEERLVQDRGAIEARVATLKRELRERQALEQNAAQAQPAPQPSPSPSPTPPPDEAAGGVAIAPWVLVGAGVLSAGAGVVLGVVAQGRAADAENEPSHQAGTDTLAAAETLATAANITFVVGGVLAAAGLTWGLVDIAGSSDEPAHAERVQLTLGVGRCGLTLLLD